MEVNEISPASVFLLHAALRRRSPVGPLSRETTSATNRARPSTFDGTGSTLKDTLNFFNPSGIPGTNAYVTLGTGVASLAAGTSISGSSTYTSGAYTSTGAGAWTLNAANIVGFRFVNAASQVRYGWMRIQVGATVTTRSFVDYAYEDTGAAINAGAVPGPAGLAALALGAMGIRGRRRK